LKSPSSIALVISDIGLFRALIAARGPIPETLMNCRKRPGKPEMIEEMGKDQGARFIGLRMRQVEKLGK